MWRAVFVALSFAVAGAADTCLKNEFTCRSGECIRNDHVCNGVPECSDRSDEKNCEFHHCEESDKFFKCGSGGQCINIHWVCDGAEDCDDGADEANCTAVPQDRSAAAESLTFCSEEEFRCSDGFCIPKSLLCDDISDCVDGDDEKREMCDRMPCKEDQFQCFDDTKGHHKCIPIRWRCDGKPDCFKEEDEANCTMSSVECPNGTFACDDHKKCVPLDKVCDGSKDCPDGSDDTEVCAVSCKGNRCQGSCVKSPKDANGTCTCPEGKAVGADGWRCEDVNECEIAGMCSQKCHNLDGSYRCSCHDGYQLEGNGLCRAFPLGQAKLFYAGRNKVAGLDLETLGGFLVTSDPWANLVGIAYDSAKRRVFWSDVSHSDGGPFIVSANLNGSGKEKFAEHSVLSSPEGLALDHVARNLYFAESAVKFIGVCSLEKMICTRLHSSNVGRPREISLYTPKGLLFFTDWGVDPRISRVGMDGSFSKAIVEDNIHWPNGVSVDAADERIYWSDAKLDLLESVKFDGSDRRMVSVNFIRHPFSIAVFEDRVFWSDWEEKKIQSCNKFTGGDLRLLANGTDLTPMGIHVYHPVLERSSRNPCASSKCSHLCLIAFGGASFTCACPADMFLSDDKANCKRRPLTALETSGRRRPSKPVSSVSNSVGTSTLPTTVAATTGKSGDAVVDSVETNSIRESKKLKIGLGVGAVIVCLIVLIACYCVYSSRVLKCKPSPVMRYKNPAFGCDIDDDSAECSEDMDFEVEKALDDSAAKDPDEKLTSNLEMVPEVHGLGGEAGDESDSSKGLLGFKVWRQKAQNRYFKL